MSDQQTTDELMLLIPSSQKEKPYTVTMLLTSVVISMSSFCFGINVSIFDIAGKYFLDDCSPYDHGVLFPFPDCIPMTKFDLSLALVPLSEQLLQVLWLSV